MPTKINCAVFHWPVALYVLWIGIFSLSVSSGDKTAGKRRKFLRQGCRCNAHVYWFLATATLNWGITVGIFDDLPPDVRKFRGYTTVDNWLLSIILWYFKNRRNSWHDVCFK
jgi:hypothetical protein